jgi:hypothetical protein
MHSLCELFQLHIEGRLVCSQLEAVLAWPEVIDQVRFVIMHVRSWSSYTKLTGHFRWEKQSFGIVDLLHFGKISSYNKSVFIATASVSAKVTTPMQLMFAITQCLFSFKCKSPRDTMLCFTQCHVFHPSMTGTMSRIGGSQISK